MEGKNYINGKWFSSDKTFESRNPANIDDILGTFPKSDEKDVDKAVSAAKEAFKEWKKMSMVKRAEIVDEFVQLVKKDKEELARLVTRECGKHINEGRADVIEGIHMAQYAFGLGRMAYGQVLSSEIAAKDAYMRRKPKGVMAVITPWNFPFAIPLWLICIPLVAGNTVVFKPSEETPLTGQRVVEYFERAGLPPGVLNLVHGIGEEAGKPLVRHPGVDVVLFTGSYEVGSDVKRVCAQDYRKLAVCEMGSKSAVLVLEDADIDLAVNASILSAFKTTGQRCVSAGRIIVDEKVINDFTDRFVRIAKRIRIGDPFDENVFMGPMINEAGVKKVEYYNDLAKKEGAEVLLDGGRLKGKEWDKGYFMSPFVYKLRHRHESKVLREEVFGPHVAIVPANGIDDAIRIYNDTDYGLSIAVITEDFRKARKVRDECEYGLGYVNLPTIGAEVHLPFGGVKKSGSHFPSAAALIDAVTHKTAWTINHGKKIEMAQGLSAEV